MRITRFHKSLNANIILNFRENSNALNPRKKHVLLESRQEGVSCKKEHYESVCIPSTLKSDVNENENELEEEKEIEIIDSEENPSDEEAHSFSSLPKLSANPEDVNGLDPILNLPFECQEEIFHHLGCKQLLNVSTVCKSWREIIDESPTVMKKTVFKYNIHSKNELQRTKKKLQNIKMKQEVISQDSEFLSHVLKFYPSLRSLSFEGIFHENAIEEFFAVLHESFHQHKTKKTFTLKHLSFIENYENCMGSTHVDMILEKFSSFMAKNLSNEESFETITLCGVSFNAFLSIMKHLRCKKIILNNMTPVNNGHYRSPINMYNMFPEFLEMSMTTMNYSTLKTIIEFCPGIKTYSMSTKDQESWGDDLRNLVKIWVFKELPIKNVSDPLINLPEELHNLIFQHLDHEELVEISSVSKTWFNATNYLISKNTMFILRREMKIRRQYNCIFMLVKNDLNTLKKIIPFAPSLEEMIMEVEIDSVKNVMFCFSVWKFKNLTTLNLASHGTSPVPGQPREPLDDLRFPETLKILHLSNFQIDSNQPGTTPFVKFLLTSKLEDLSFFECKNLDNLFIDDVLSESSMKLQSLRLPIYKRFTSGHNNFNKFLLSQSATLEELFLHKVNVRTINEIIENFHLKSFGFFSILGRIENFNVQIQTCPSLEQLQLAFPSLAGLEPYLRLAPKLRILHIPKLNDKILQYVKENFGFIEEIQYAKNKLRTLKNEARSGVYRGIQLLPQDHFEEFDDLTNFHVEG